jgi:hypothetical protein
MKKLASIIPLFLTVAASWGEDATNNVPSRLDYPSFRLISERNIFNANRYARRAGEETRRPEPERRYTRTESFALVGTMSYEKGRFAFFEGSSSQYNQILSTSSNIAGFTITEVTPNSVKLASNATNSQPVELPVGMQLKRQDEGEWQLSERTETSRTYASSSSSSSRSSSGSSGSENSEVLKRLMQQREGNDGGQNSATTEPGSTTVSEPSATQPDPRVERVEIVERPPQKVEKTESGANSSADDILKKLMEKREQEINK